MAFKKLNMQNLTGGAKNNKVPSKWSYWNEDGDNVYASSFFDWDVLTAGDQVEVVNAGKTLVEDAYISAVSGGKGTLSANTDTRTDAGAVSLTSRVTNVVTTGAKAITLADGVEGQIKIIVFKTDGGNATLTPANLAGGSTITFSDVGDTATLVFTGGTWYVSGISGATVA